MTKNKITIDLDVNLNHIKSISLKQYNQNSQWLIIRITENGKPFYIEDDDICIFKMCTPDKREIYNDCVFVDNCIVVEITQNCCTNYGTGNAELNILDADKKAQIASFNFNIVIEKSVFDNEDIEGSNEFGTLVDRIIAADKAIENAEIATDNATAAAENANAATKDLQDKLDSHHFVLTEDKDVANGVPSLDDNAKVPISELYDATTAQKGITQLTDSVTSTSNTTAATPNSVKTVNDAVNAEQERAIESERNLESKKANLASPTFTGIPNAPTASVGTSTTQIATTEFVQTSVSNGIAASDAMIIKGTIGNNVETGIHGTVDVLPTTYKTGWTYRVVADGTYAGQICEIGDLIIALVDRNGSNNLNSDWCVAQTNINGAITGVRNGDDYIECSQSGSVITIKHKDVPRTNTTSTVSSSNGGNFTAVKSVISDSKGHVTSVDTETVTLPSEYAHPTTSGNKHIPSGGTSSQILKWISDGTATWGDAPISLLTQEEYDSLPQSKKENGTVYFIPDADNSSSSGSDNLPGIKIVDSAFSLTSENPVQNKVITERLNIILSDMETLDSSIENKVDKLSGKGLSTNDYTTNEKNKLNGISAGAEVNVQSDWNITDTTSDAFIKNKPLIPTIPSALKNPNSLTFTGSVAESYDGSIAKSVEIPSVGNGNITIKQNGLTKGTFSVNQSENLTIELTDNDTAYSDATTSIHGLMSASDKTKLNGISANANNYSLPLASSTVRGGVKTGYTQNGRNFPVQLDNEQMYVNVPGSEGGSGEGASKEIYGDTFVSMGRKNGSNIGENSFAFGDSVIAASRYSHSEGYYTEANFSCAYAVGDHTRSNNYAAHVSGKFNKTLNGMGGQTNQLGDVFAIGNGTRESDRSNAFRVTYTGDIYGTKAFQSSGADYAEYFEKEKEGIDEDWVGLFVTIKDGYIKKANKEDYILGIVSGNPSIIGNSDEDYYWRYERDEFNRIVMEDVPEMVQVKDRDGNPVFDKETHIPVMEKTGRMIPNARMKLAEDYDPSKQNEYIPRERRDEWECVGMLGVLPVRDDGTCLPNHYCKCGADGIATFSSERGFDTFYVIKRVSDNVVSVIMR